MNPFTTMGDRLKHGWNAFNGKSPNVLPNADWSYGYSSSYRPDRNRLYGANGQSITGAIYNRIAVDASAVNIIHARLDPNDNFLEVMSSSLQSVLSTEANTDQTGRCLLQDIVLSMLGEGVVAVVPTDTTYDPNNTEAYDILAARTGKILDWYPKHVRVRLYNEATGQREDIVVAKKDVAIIENPFYSVMNEQSSTLQRLVRKLNLLDAIDEQSGSGKLDIIIQLPYLIKSEARKKQAEERRQALEDQLSGSKYGIGYTDGTEKVTQLNRPVENNLMGQITYLTSMLYGQLSMTESIINGTADEATILNYYNRTIDPILNAITEEMKRKFLTKTARSQKQTVMYLRDLFKLATITTMAEIGDKLTRNEVLTSNELRGKIGMRPSTEPSANELRNKNIAPISSAGPPTSSSPPPTDTAVQSDGRDAVINDLISSLESQVDNILGGGKDG